MADPNGLTDQDFLEWAKQNPNTPEAYQIFKKLGVTYQPEDQSMEIKKTMGEPSQSRPEDEKNRLIQTLDSLDRAKQDVNINSPHGQSQLDTIFQQENSQIKRAKAIADLYKAQNGRNVPTKTIDDIVSLLEIQDTLPILAKIKTSGFGGEGVDTGPLAQQIPASVSEAYNKLEGYGESSADRGKLRQAEKIVFNPIKQKISGKTVSDQERKKDLLPMVPNEAMNDQDFLNNSIETARQSQSQLIILIESLKRAGLDVSGFDDLLAVTPEQYRDQFIEMLVQAEDPKKSKYGISKELPDTYKSYLDRVMKKKKSQQQGSGNLQVVNGRVVAQ